MKTALLFFAVVLTAPPVSSAEKQAATHLIFAATVGKTAISVRIAERPFDPTRHKITAPRNVGDDTEPATVDGRNVVGTDEPVAGKPQLSRLTVQFGKRRIDVPQKLLAHVFNPQLSPAKFNHAGVVNSVSVSADGRAVMIHLAVGDGEYARTIFFYVGADGTCTDEPLAAYEP